jgi:predicted Zn-dependent peptidase
MTQIPTVGAPRPLRPPRVAEAKLPNGMRILVVRKPTVPRVEIRLVCELGPVRNLAVERVLAKALTSGTASRTSTEIAEEIQRLGATLGTSVGLDHFQLSGSVLSMNLRPFLELCADILMNPTFPSDEVELERARLTQELEMSRSQPQVVATEALRKRLFGRHRYARVLPEPKTVSRVSRAALQHLLTKTIGPRGGFVVVAGDVQPQAVIEALGSTIGSWRTRIAKPDPSLPVPPKRGPVVFVDRPGSVQTSIKMATEIPKVGSDESYAVDIANTIFGGYFISRWVDNLRERHGYTYSPHSQPVYHRLANYLEISADVGADVTAAALVETHYELGRMCAVDVDPDELLSAKRYRTGIQSLRIGSQAGLASVLAGLVTHGLGVDYLRDFPKRVMALTAAEVREASERYLAPSRLVTVLVGDASRVAAGVEPLHDVLVQRQTS